VAQRSGRYAIQSHTCALAYVLGPLRTAIMLRLCARLADFPDGQLAAGVSGGFVSTLVVHPLDVVNTRLQVQGGKISHLPKYRSTLHGLRNIVKHEGVRYLYAGLYPNLVGSTVSWGFYFYGYNVMREVARKHLKAHAHAESGPAHLSPTVNLACASTAGVLTAVCTQPIWLAKTRLQLQHGSSVQYTGMLHVLASVRRHEGVLGLWRGLLPSLMLVSHVSIHFTVYEEIKKCMLPYSDGDGRLHSWQTFIAGSLAKMFASVMTYPFQVVRARMQQLDPRVLAARTGMSASGLPSPAKETAVASAGGSRQTPVQTSETPHPPSAQEHAQARANAHAQPQAHGEAAEAGRRATASRQAARVSEPKYYYRGPFDTVAKIFRNEGVRGLFKGLSTNLLRVVPSAAITFVVYEKVAALLGATT
jgi:solute carrier family 25 folate transporter 32